MVEAIESELLADDGGITAATIAPIFEDSQAGDNSESEIISLSSGRKGLTNKELSEKTGTPKGTISPWKSRGRDKVQTAKDGSRWLLGADDRWYPYGGA
ncbi:MAG: hypothetical protein N5P05_004589 [Chroococcopsis gigantea SAG 12.99]|nr:hypothetical protein [Chroococcopsis gigantea SAG 12.99]